MAAVTTSSLIDLPPRGETARRRAVLDGLLKSIDVLVAAVAFVCGVFVFIAPPPTILREVSLPWLVGLWGGFLIVGGLSALVGRVTGIWLAETAGIAAMGGGALIYFAVVTTAIGRELGVTVASGLILIAFLSMARRYVQLLIFTSEPGDVSLWERIVHLFRIRTTAPRP